MASLGYRNIEPLSDRERAAARSYAVNSGFFHLVAQSDHSVALNEYPAYQQFIHGHSIPDLMRSSLKYETTKECAVYSGHGNASGVFGSLLCDDISRLVGMTWQYRGFTSTTSDKVRAYQFLRAKYSANQYNAVLLEFRLPVGFPFLPMEELGADMTNEAEYLIGPRTICTIESAEVVSVEGLAAEVIKLVLIPKAPST